MTTYKNSIFTIVWGLLISGGIVVSSFANYETTTDIRFRELQGIEPSHQSLDFFVPQATEGEEAPSNLPVILYVHGGRWMTGDKHIEDTPMLNFFIDQGFVVVSTNYRLSVDGKNQHPAQIEDVADAVGWISDNIRYRSGNPRAIYLVGHGAGAHLVALLATDHSRLMDVGVRPVDIKGVVLLDPLALDLVEIMQSDDLSKSYHQAAFGDKLESWREASPFHHIRSDFPHAPHLIVAACPLGWPSQEQLTELKAKRWTAIDQYAEKLRENEVRVDLVNAMQFQSFRSVDRDIGTANDQTTQIVADFLQELENLRTERTPVPTKGTVHTLTVEGEEWEKAAKELGNVAFDLWNFEKSRDLDTPITSAELPKELRMDFISWDTNNNEFLDRTEIQAAFEALFSD